jgi:hypothetical protein
LLRIVAAYRPAGRADIASATKLALRTLGRRYLSLTEEIKALDAVLAPLVAATAPALLTRPGVGTEIAGALLVAAGDNPERLHSERSFAHLCGVALLDASSGKQQRHRLNRGGDRQANSALWRIVMTRIVYHPPTRDYLARRTAEGLSTKEAMRCLKRYVARELYQYLPRAHWLDFPRSINMRYMDMVKTIAAVVCAVALLVIAGTTLRLLERQDDLLQVERFQSGCLQSIVVNLRAAPGAIQHPDCVYPAGGGRTISVAGALAIVHAHGVVITVLWNGKEGRRPLPALKMASRYLTPP